MFNLKWMFFLTITLIWMGGGDFAGCGGCACPAYEIEYQRAFDARKSAEAAYETAVTNGADQQTLDQLDAERIQADKNLHEAERLERLHCN